MAWTDRKVLPEWTGFVGQIHVSFEISLLFIACIITCTIDFTNVFVTWKSLDELFFSSSYVRYDILMLRW